MQTPTDGMRAMCFTKRTSGMLMLATGAGSSDVPAASPLSLLEARTSPKKGDPRRAGFRAADQQKPATARVLSLPAAVLCPSTRLSAARPTCNADKRQLWSDGTSAC